MGIEVLSDKSLLLVFAYSPAGLGHLRVTEALYHGLPKSVISHLLGSDDQLISFFHRITSVNTLFRSIVEKGQVGRAEDLSTISYRRLLISNTQTLYSKLITVLEQMIESPKIILVVATHFGLAHQLSYIKEKIEKERKIKIILVVQVTDDSPQHIWFIRGADLIMVPSTTTKELLEKYGKEMKFTPVRFEVAPYPVSPFLTRELTQKKLNNRKLQVEAGSKEIINMAIPISGAAVGTGFFTEYIDNLYESIPRFLFRIITKVAPYTSKFISEMNSRSYVSLSVSSFDRGIVEKYEKVYLENVISLEVTKPSEQSFKALINPSKVGGSILLFATPVGRQEYDNLSFLRRHDLIPKTSQQQFLWDKSFKNVPLNESNKKEYLELAREWRGLILPKSALLAAKFTAWCLKEGIFSAMLNCKVLPRKINSHTNELSDNGVSVFWEKVAGVVRECYT